MTDDQVSAKSFSRDLDKVKIRIGNFKLKHSVNHNFVISEYKTV